ncbi:MAG: hypothetical protein E6Q89_08740 [Bacteroidia bacterium]|nr:MAG: hypothetical protein E6Q89_08740 [Bacteroidia bacterium]
MKHWMKTVALVFLLTALVCGTLTITSNYSFSLMFKITLLSISGFICSFAIHKAKYSQLFSGLSILSFGALLFILFNPAQFELFWNYVLVLHILLIGFLVDKTIGTIGSSKFYIQLIALISMKITLVLFAIIVLFKLNSNFIFNLLLILLCVSSLFYITALIVNLKYLKENQ